MLDDEEGAEEKGETGFSPSNSCKHREPETCHDRSRTLLLTLQLYSRLLLSLPPMPLTPLPSFPVVRDPRYTGLLQVGRVVDFSTCLFVEPRERNGKRDEFNLILYACLMKPMSGDDFMPFQLDGSRFDRAESPLTLDAGEISRNLSLSFSLISKRIRSLNSPFPPTN